MHSEPPDLTRRQRALDPCSSFVVQAPAGSGKTGLLVRRYLSLLARVSSPEEILAITFTRKATFEMRHRIIQALQARPEDIAGHDPQMAEIVQAVLENDRHQGWDLRRNVGRLKIQTIDSFCYELVAQMPWSAKFGAQPEVVDELRALDLYSEAANNVLCNIASENHWSADSATLLGLLDMRYDRALALLAALLARRDHWIADIENFGRSHFEENWKALVVAELRATHDLLPDEVRTELGNLLNFAATNLRDNESGNPLAQCGGITGFPAPQPEQLVLWQCLSRLLATKDGEKFRTRFTVNDGFPPGTDAEKKKILAIQEELTTIPGLLRHLAVIPLLPQPRFSNEQWAAIESLLALAPLAVAELRLLFAEDNVADFSEVSQRAAQALWDSGGPTSLALSLDYRINHILMDEVQDASESQFRLLETLVAGWEKDDGRTLFLVGDPMQSIYRFRMAEVAKFLDIREKGINQVSLEPVVLECNFRSSAELITWFNHTFSEIFPPRVDPVMGAIPYSMASSVHSMEPVGIPDVNSSDVHYHAGLDEDRLQQADRISAQIKHELEWDDQATIGVLARNRSHLIEIAASLKRHDTPFQAVQLESLWERPAIQDLVALTRALLQPADRTAWLSLLRSPWCGLSLPEITAIAGRDHERSVLELLLDPLTDISESATKRIQRLTGVMSSALDRSGKTSLFRNVEAAWINLGGPQSINPRDAADCSGYFKMLAELESGAGSITAQTLARSVERLWSNTTGNARVQLLTIHKSKGLEFDVVILPWLNGTPRVAEQELLRWTRSHDQLLVAALPHSDAKSEDRFNSYLRRREGELDHNELYRLLYVACTRARTRLHLFMSVSRNANGTLKLPPKRSLLRLLWPVLESEIEPVEPEVRTSLASPTQSGALRRLPADWTFSPVRPQLEARTPDSARMPSVDREIEFSWATEIARVTGIVMHRLLEEVDSGNWHAWKSRNTAEVVSDSSSLLREEGLAGSHLESASRRISETVRNLKSDSRADWIFSDAHSEVRREWRITGMDDGHIAQIIIDRSFQDSDGIRWVIDFKFSRHLDADRELFLDTEQQRYQDQLEQYARILAALRPGPIKLGLYFPLLKGWREWPAP